MIPKKILVIHQYFEPAFRAGGPIRSIAHMIQALEGKYRFDVICSAHDLNDTEVLPGIQPDEWTDWKGIAQVYYDDGSIFRLIKLIRGSDADIVFINGVFSLRYSLLPLLINRARKCVLSVRGMLKPYAMKQKRAKKEVFMFFFRMLHLQKRVFFHVTDHQEGVELEALFPQKVNWVVAGNFPKMLDRHDPLPKEKGSLTLCTVSLINRIKNHGEILRVLKEVKGFVRYYIYGPVHDAAYMAELERMKELLPENIQVQFAGEIYPDKVEDAIAASQVFILPSKTENFGHSIFEALAVGRPVITTSNTPWKGLELQDAGKTIDLDQNGLPLKGALQQYIDMDGETYRRQCASARKVAESFINAQRLAEQYELLFSI